MKKLAHYLFLIRVKQWTKNFLTLAPLVFSNNLFQPLLVIDAIQAFFIFCILASVIYIFNDLVDCDADKHHPQKCRRPLASGVLQKKEAYILLGSFLTIGFCWALLLNFTFFLIALSYLLINIFYSFILKRIVIVDVMTIALNYVIRVIAGAVAIAAPITPHLIILSSFLALFLAFGKRRHELLFLGNNSESHRTVLREYTPYLLDQFITIVAVSTLFFYSFYTIDERTRAFFRTDLMPITIPFVLFGLFRYIYLIHQKNTGGDPGETIITDFPLVVDILSWLIITGYLVYVMPR